MLVLATVSFTGCYGNQEMQALLSQADVGAGTPIFTLSGCLHQSRPSLLGVARARTRIAYNAG